MMPSTTNHSPEKTVKQNRKNFKKYLAHAISVIVLFVIWIIAASIIDSSVILPFPKEVGSEIFLLLSSKLYWKSLLFTFIRIFTSFTAAFIIGLILGIACSESKFFNDFLVFPLTLIRSTPVVALILVILFWFNSGFVPVIISFLMLLPIIISSVKSGIENTNPKLLFLAKCHNFNKFQTLFYIKLPAAKINILEGMQQSFSLSWKVVIAAEVLSIPKYALGSMIQRSQVHIETGEVIANTLILVFISYFLQSIAGFLLHKGKTQKKSIIENQL